MPRPTGIQPVSARLTPQLLSELASEMADFTPRVRERGQKYAVAGRVGPLAIEGLDISAAVRGTKLYRTAWLWGDGYWVSECTCPVAPDCKHAYALACCILAYAQQEMGFEDRRLVRLLPPAAYPVSPAMRQRATVIPLAAAARAVRAQPAALNRLRTATQIYEREYALGEILAESPTHSVSPYLSPFPEILQEPDADLRCHLLARAIAERAGGWLPSPLESYRDRGDLADRLLTRTRASVTAELVQWAQRVGHTSQRSLRLVLSLQEKAGGDAAVVWQARVTTPRLKDQPRTIAQLLQMRTEARDRPGVLPPDQLRLLEWLVGHSAADVHAYGSPSMEPITAQLKSLLDWASGSPLVTWAEDIPPDLSARGGMVPGAPVRLSTDAVRLLPACVSRPDGLWIELRFFWSHTQRRFEDVVYVPCLDGRSRFEPSFVLADGAFSLVAQAPPAGLLTNFRRAGGLPVAIEERERMMGLLAAAFPHLDATVRSHTRFHRVTPVVAADLREDDWLQVRIFARATPSTWKPGQILSDGAVVFEYHPHLGWGRPAEPRTGTADPASFDMVAAVERDDTSPSEIDTAGPALAPESASEPDIWGEAPDPSCVEAVLAWLAATQAAPGDRRSSGGPRPPWPDHDVGWWLLASRKRMQHFGECWERRPADAQYFGNERLRRMFAGPDRVTPRLRIEASGVDWFAISAEWEAEGRQLSEADLARLRAATTRFVKLPSGWVQRDVALELDETADALADLGIEVGVKEERLSLWQLAGAKPESLRVLERLGADTGTLRAAEQLRERIVAFAGLPRIEPPAGLTATLRPYQQTGLDFLTYTAAIGIGSILADDMGLGKTVQALAWLQHLRAHDPEGGPSLVVCPASVVHNWLREAERFVPGMRVLLLTSGSSRHELRREIPEHDLVVTNYALLRRDIEQWRKIELRAAILDEAQNIKNPDAAVTRAAFELRARHRAALTGTPMENRALDLWSITQFVNPGYLGSRAQFGARFDRVDAPQHLRTLLAAKMRPILLRRTKQEVAPDLPERIEERLDCELTKGQRQLYLAELRRSRALIEALSDDRGGLRKNKIHVLAALTRLRQICCHPALAGGAADLGSGKFDTLFELLEPLLAEGHKVLVFSQFVECLKLLSAELRRRRIVQHTLTGKTMKREKVVQGFQDDASPCVFLVSLKAGGTGLNLTAASYVVLFDPWWNPAVEAQAIDRVHRIGQKRTVIAYRMLAAGTIEDRIWELQQRKAALTEDILGEGSFGRSLTREDLDYLLEDV